MVGVRVNGMPDRIDQPSSFYVHDVPSNASVDVLISRSRVGAAAEQLGRGGFAESAQAG